MTRAIMLFGKNTASYKFALMDSLVKLKPTNSVSYDDIRDNFVSVFLEHYRDCPNQFTRGSTKFTEACDKHLAGILTWDELISVAERNIYNNVFDAFHHLGGGSISREHILFEHHPKERRLVLTGALNEIQSSPELRDSIISENAARWRVVEEAWRNSISPSMILDPENGLFYTIVNRERINLRSAVKTLEPYQKGLCFYCGIKLRSEGGAEFRDYPDVDHCIPLSLFKVVPFAYNPNGVWNLVLACRDCNRGPDGKFDKVPARIFFEALTKRNLYFAEEHKHSMRFSVLSSLGINSTAQILPAMQKLYKLFDSFEKWKPREAHCELKSGDLKG